MATPTLSVAVTAPDEVETGEEFSVDASVQVNNYNADDPLAIGVALLEGDAVISQQEIETADQQLVSFSHAFAEPGDHQLTVAAELTYEEETVRGLEQTTIAVTGDPLSDGSGDGGPVTASESLLEAGGWKVLSESEERVFEETQGPITVTADAHTTIYENADLQTEIADRTLDKVDVTLAFFFSTWVEFSHDIADLPQDTDEILADIRAQSEDQFLNELAFNGVENVEAVDEGTVATAGGETAETTIYEGTFSFDPIEFTVGSDTTITIEGDEISVAGRLAIWENGQDAIVAGGAYPAENYAKVLDKTINEALDLELVIDLGLEPDAYDAELTQLIQSVS